MVAGEVLEWWWTCKRHDASAFHTQHIAAPTTVHLPLSNSTLAGIFILIQRTQTSEKNFDGCMWLTVENGWKFFFGRPFRSCPRDRGYDDGTSLHVLARPCIWQSNEVRPSVQTRQHFLNSVSSPRFRTTYKS